MKNVQVSFISYTINNSWNDWDVDNKSFKKKINLIFRISREDGRPFSYCKNDFSWHFLHNKIKTAIIDQRI